MREHPERGYTHLARGVVRLVDAGSSCSIEFMRRQLQEGVLFQWLQSEAAGIATFDLSVYPVEDQEAIVERFKSIDNATRPGKLGAENNGLALLLGWCIEGVQMYHRLPD